MSRTKGVNRAIFSLVTLAVVGMQLVVVPAMPAAAISPAVYYGPPADGTFTYNRNTTYSYNFTYSISTVSGSTFNTERWIPMITNRTMLGTGGAVYQQAFVTRNLTYDTPLAHSFDVDDFGNEFHYFDLSVPNGNTWAMNVQGNLMLRDIKWLAQSGVTAASYNKTDGLYATYTQEEEYINKTFPAIAAAAVSLNNSNPWTTVQNVYNYIKNLLTYSAQTEEHGAEWAITYHTGDCTEYSYLMVALLRACGIPARVMRGLVIANSAGAAVSPNYGASPGTKWNYVFETTGESLSAENMTGHAWSEFFIPGTGWVLSDPTWNSAGDYVTRIDNIHVPYTVGVWIGQGLTPSLPIAESPPVSDLSTIPYPFYIRDGVNQALRYEFTVLLQEAPPSLFDQILAFIMANPWVIGVLIGFIVLLVVIKAARSRRKNKTSYYGGDDSYRERVTFST